MQAEFSVQSSKSNWGLGELTLKQRPNPLCTSKVEEGVGGASDFPLSKTGSNTCKTWVGIASAGANPCFALLL